MSGGSFDYAYRRAEIFSESLGERLDENYGENGAGFGPYTIAALRKIETVANYAAKLMKEAEWLYSGDIGEEGFAEAIKGELGAMEADSAALRALVVELVDSATSAAGWLPYHDPSHPDYEGARSDCGRLLREKIAKAKEVLG